MMTLRCGRIDPHPEHEWKSHPAVAWRGQTWRCTGQVVVAGAERLWDEADDAAEEAMLQEARDA